MTSKVFSSFHLCSNPTQSHKNPAAGNFSGVSFSSHVSKSRISVGGPHRARVTARVDAVYAPAAGTRETLYELLGISETGSSLSDIKKAYKQMARMYHPDVSPPDRVDEHTRRFIMVHQAYETLSNPKTRALYDRDLDRGFGFSFPATRSHTEMVEKEEWKGGWQSQLDELKRRDSRGKMSWAARMRHQRS